MMNIKKILKEEIAHSIVDKLISSLSNFNTPNMTVYDSSGNLVDYNYFVPVGESLRISGYNDEENKSFPSNLLNLFNSIKNDENILIVKEFTTRSVSKGKGFNDLGELKNYAEINKVENVYDLKASKNNYQPIEKLIPDFALNKTKDDVTYPNDLLSKLTLKGSQVILFHYGSHELENGVLDPKHYQKNNYTSDTAGQPRIFFYIRREDKERIVNGKEYIVQVPLKDLYPFNSDPLNFYNDAVKEYGSQNVPVAHQMAIITKKVLEFGFKGMIFSWEGTYRVDYFFPIKPLN